MAGETGVPLRGEPNVDSGARSSRRGSDALTSMRELRRTLRMDIAGGVMEPLDIGESFQEPPVSNVPSETGSQANRAGDRGTARTTRSTIFAPVLEEKFSVGTFDWLRSYQGLFLQVGICVFFTLLTAYDAVCKSKAVRLSKPPSAPYRPFDFASLVIWVSVVSVALGAALAWRMGNLGILLNRESPLMCLKYAPIGILFAFTNYLQFVALIYLDPDIFGILDQARLLMLGGLSWAILGKRQSQLAWIVLCVISIAAVSYSFVREGSTGGRRLSLLDELVEDLLSTPKYNVSMAHSDEPCLTVGSAGVGPGHECRFPFRYKGETFYDCDDYAGGIWCSVETDAKGEHVSGQWGDCPPTCQQPLRFTLIPERVLGCSGKDSCRDVTVADVDRDRLSRLLTNLDDPKTLQHLLLKEELIRGLAPQFGIGTQDSKSSQADSFATGVVLTIVFMVLQSFASVYQELVLKKYKDIPFYVQKVYQETWSVVFSLLNTSVIAPYMARMGYGRKAKDEAAFFSNPFYGWESPWVIICFIFLFMRSWLIVLILKMLSSIIKQLCSVCAIALVYFLMIMHTCKHVDNGNAFWCSWDPAEISLSVALSDVGVVLSVMAYILLLAREKELEALKAEAATKNNELEVELSGVGPRHQVQPSG